MEKRRIYDLEDRTKRFAKNVADFVQKLPRTLAHREYVPQLIRSSGSIAANYIEANESVGPNDFPMRVRICLRESKESALWLELCNAGNLEQERLALVDEAHQFVRMFSAMLRNHYKNKKALKVAV
jgi:four helix bundle protein